LEIGRRGGKKVKREQVGSGNCGLEKAEWK